jgi:NAD-dependent dihydropyrimidine dehydrogenase PreA subunit
LRVDELSGKCRVINEGECDRLAGCQKFCPVQAIKII